MQYIHGSLTNPIYNRNALIIHICNNKNLMGSGVAKALYEVYPIIKKSYHDMDGQDLGDVDFVKISDSLYCANMIAMEGLKGVDNPVPLDYGALKLCLEKVRDFAVGHQTSIHLPYKMGCDRAGGNWETVSELLENILNFLNVSIYYL